MEDLRAVARRALRPPDYAAPKEHLERVLLAQFARRFPALAPQVRHVELSTPLTTTHFTRARHGAAYGLEVTPQRFLCEALRPHTPVPGLLLAGQDVITPGTTGALMGGFMAAAALEPALYRRLPRA